MDDNPFHHLFDEEGETRMSWLIHHCADLEDRVRYLEQYARALQRNVLTMKVTTVPDRTGGDKHE